ARSAAALDLQRLNSAEIEQEPCSPGASTADGSIGLEPNAKYRDSCNVGKFVCYTWIMVDYTLVHPLYLDESMMISFLAYLEGGVAFEGEETVRSGKTGDRKVDGSGKFKFPLIGALIGAEFGASGSTSRKSEESAEYKAARHHTTASLFNALNAYLHEDGLVIKLDDPNQLPALKTGQLVEVAGKYRGNPLEEVLALMGQLLSYMNLEEDASPNQEEELTAAKAKRSKNPAIRSKAAELAAAEASPKLVDEEEENSKAGLRILLKMREDIEKAPVHDLLVRTLTGLQAVLTVSSEYFTSATNEYLRAGEFVVLGKVTRILNGDDNINLTRRTVMGVAGPDVSRQLIKDVTDNPAFYLESTDPIISAPAVQILPMAIFI
ncbi:MAG: hypothetical protein JWN52_7455, partial [Actinomycetia bacterium]|nr:hypothetical protein [Actinomycetes bacterium]